jgi:hypothetical protein
MRRGRAKQTLKLRLLALVLALALSWYSINPAPRLPERGKREGDEPDAKKREAEPRRRAALWLPPLAGRRVAEFKDSSSPIDDDDDFEWPEYIDG